VAKLTGADKKIAELGKKAVSDIIGKARSMKKPSVKDYDWHSGNNSYSTSRNSYTVPKSSYTVPKSAYTVPKRQSSEESSYADKAASIRQRANLIREQMRNGEWQDIEAGEKALNNLRKTEEDLRKKARDSIHVIRVK
jgi:hypothetical protein